MQQIADWLEKLGMSEYEQPPAGMNICKPVGLPGAVPVALSPIRALFGMLNLAIVPDR